MPIILIICGLPGVGKTTVARQIAPLVKGVVLSTDKIRKDLFHKPKYGRREKKLVYDILILLTKYLSSANVNCILDGTFSKEKTRQDVLTKLGHNAKVYIIECVCPEHIVMARLNARKLDYSDADFSVYRKVKRMYQPVKEKHIKIDTSRMSSLEICIGGYSVETNKILKIFHHPNLAKLVEQFPYKLKLYFLFVEAKTYVQQKTEFSISIFVRSNLLYLRN